MNLTRGIAVAASLLALGLALPVAAAKQELPVAEYGIGDWAANGLGNHRAVAEIPAAADAVKIRIPWRRHDAKPDEKAILVYDANGKRQSKVAVFACDADSGEIVFAPESGPGHYFIYYMPYEIEYHYFGNPGTYLAPEKCSDPAWERAAMGSRATLPEAKLTRLEARSEFNRFDPMEVCATAGECAELVAEYPDRPFLVFAEDRRNPVRMHDRLPVKWIQSGPAKEFSGAAQPDEWYAFQLAVWADRGALKGLSASWSDLSGATAAIPAAEITCINTEGVDSRGRAFHKTLVVPAGDVQPLWFVVKVPADAHGDYAGSVTLHADGLPEQTIPIHLTVAGEQLTDHGVSEPWRHARLLWLNSTIGGDYEVIPPFTPVEGDARHLAILGRSIDFDALGFPSAIFVGEEELLAAPVRFEVTAATGPLVFEAGKTEETLAAPARVDFSSEASAPGATLTVNRQIEADGTLIYDVTLKATQVLDLSDVRLVVPVKASAAPYSMGFGIRGGFRRDVPEWRWEPDRATNYFWLGGVDGGLQLKLTGATDNWDSSRLTDVGLPEGWYNGGAGGAQVTESDGTVKIVAFSGARKLAANQEVVFRFRFLVTPLRPTDPRHWDFRYGKSWADKVQKYFLSYIFHGEGGNRFINYPFIDTDALRERIEAIRSEPMPERNIETKYPLASGINWEAGSIEAEVRVNFDPAINQPGNSQFNRSLWNIKWPDGDEMNAYWCSDPNGIRVYLRKGKDDKAVYPVLYDVPLGFWRPGETHKIGVSWQRDGTISTWIDGKRMAEMPYLKDWGAGHGPSETDLIFRGDSFSLLGVRVRSSALDDAGAKNFDRDPATVLLETPEVTDAETSRRIAERDFDLYYTVRELSSHAVELWALHSLGDEVIAKSAFVYHPDGSAIVSEGGGYPWLQEHLSDRYAPAWRHPIGGDELDAAIAVTGDSRWNNYYLEGLNYLMKNFGMRGLYLDGIGYDRDIMRRVAKVMYANDPDYRINCHVGNNYDFLNLRANFVNNHMEHLPYVSSLWAGEMFNYDTPPDYWLVEISGLPFGLTSEMLNYDNGGNMYRAMQFGMAGRQNPSCDAIWALWDEFGIADAELLGWWNPACPVHTDIPKVTATVYRKPGESLIALANWPGERVVRRGTAGPRGQSPLRLEGMYTYPERKASAQQTTAEVSWDDRNLYVDFTVTGRNVLKADAWKQDGKLWEDDSVEIHLRPDGNSRKIFQFIGNSQGVYLDARNGDATWNCALRYTVEALPDGWRGAMAIPWEALELKPRAGMSFGFNLAVNRTESPAEIATWNPVAGEFLNCDNFGVLTLDNKAEADSHLSSPGVTECRLSIDWVALGLDPAHCKVFEPALDHFQEGKAAVDLNAPFPIPEGKGLLIWLKADR